MKIIYLGTPDFAVLPLKKIVESGFEVVAVVSQPDRPVGRKREIKPTPVKACAQELGIPVYQFEKIRNEYSVLKELNADIMVTCAYGQILTQEVIDLTPKGVFNIHASLLPKYRGASPIQSCILQGETKTGVTIMKTDIGVDTGDIVSVAQTQILPLETAGELFDRLSVIGSDLIVETLKKIELGQQTYTPQNHQMASHCKMINKADCQIDFNLTQKEIINKIRAFNPAPVAFTKFNGKGLKIYSATPCDYSGTAGEVLYCDKLNGLVIACKDKSIKVLELQEEGGKKMSSHDYILGRKIKQGDKAEL